MRNTNAHVIVLAGPNGAGKTTVAPALLQGELHVDEFINADIIAQGLSVFKPEQTAMQAGRLMLQRIKQLASERVNFAFETTLATRSFAPWLKRLKDDGYAFHLVYLWLPNAEFSIKRVRERVKLGGHDVPHETIRRRYQAGLNNFFQLYQSLTDSWDFYDNSRSGDPSLIASQGKNKTIEVHSDAIWEKIEVKHGC